MANGKVSLDKVEFAKWNADGTPIDGEVSTGSTTCQSSANGMAGAEKREPTSWTNRGSSIYRLFTDKITFICNRGKTSKYVQFGQSIKEQGDSVSQKEAILKKVAAVLVAILVAILVMYVYHQNSALVKENDNLKTTNSALVQEIDDIKATDELVKEAINARVNNWIKKYNQSSALVDGLKATNGALVKEMDDWKEKYNRASALVKYLKVQNAVKATSMVKQLANGFKGITTTRFSGIQNYLDSGGKRKAGESFSLDGLSWHLLFERSYNGHFLEVLLCYDFADFFGYTFRDRSTTVTFDLTLVNHDDKGKSKNLNSFKGVYEPIAEYHCWGSGRIIRISDLYDGFIKEDALEFEVQIKSVDLDLID